MKGYKGFEKGLICRGKQYAVGELFEEPTVSFGQAGMHFCERPEDVLIFYGLFSNSGELNEFAEVEAPAGAIVEKNGTRFCTNKLIITKKLSFSEFIEAVNASIGAAAADKKNSLASSDAWSALASSGNYAKLASTGDYARLASSGKNCVVCCTGNDGRAKAAVGSWITLAEWGKNGDKEYAPVCVKTEYVDGVKIKGNCWYKVKNGKFCEVNQDEDGN